MAKTLAPDARVLNQNQKRVLDAVVGEEYFTERYYLAGGTALSAFHLHHRVSEDLDFFIEAQEVNPLPVEQFLKKQSAPLQIKKWETKRFLGLHSFFLHFRDGSVLKVDFNYYPFPRIERGSKYHGLEIEDIYDIGVDKVHTIVLKPRARDFIDIFFIVRERHYDWHDLLMQAKAKFDWDISAVELGARFMETSKMTDYPRMLKPIDHNEWKQFFVEEARKLKKEIFK